MVVVVVVVAATPNYLRQASQNLGKYCWISRLHANDTAESSDKPNETEKDNAHAKKSVWGRARAWTVRHDTCVKISRAAASARPECPLLPGRGAPHARHARAYTPANGVHRPAPVWRLARPANGPPGVARGEVKRQHVCAAAHRPMPCMCATEHPAPCGRGPCSAGGTV